MTTEALRKVIKVTDWSLSETGLTISYLREGHQPQLLHLILSPSEAGEELLKMGLIDKVHTEFVFSIEWDGMDANWATFILNYKFCQWEAISMAIRHEEEKELSKDMNLLELDAAIAALK